MKNVFKKNQTSYAGDDVHIAFYEYKPSFSIKSRFKTVLLKWTGSPRLYSLYSYFSRGYISPRVAKTVNAPVRDICKVPEGEVHRYINGVEFLLHDASEDMSGYYTGVIYPESIYEEQVISYATMHLDVKPRALSLGLTIFVIGIGVMVFIALAIVLAVYVRSKTKRAQQPSPPRPLIIGPSSISEGLLSSSDHEYSVANPEQRGDASYLAVDPNSVCDTSESVPAPRVEPKYGSGSMEVEVWKYGRMEVELWKYGSGTMEKEVWK